MTAPFGTRRPVRTHKKSARGLLAGALFLQAD